MNIIGKIYNQITFKMALQAPILGLHSNRQGAENLFIPEPAVRFELTTVRLQGGCSTTELCRHYKLKAFLIILMRRDLCQDFRINFLEIYEYLRLGIEHCSSESSSPLDGSTASVYNFALVVDEIAAQSSVQRQASHIFVYI